MDMFLASLAILGWGSAIAVALWFNSKCERLADELRLALLFNASLQSQVDRYKNAASNLLPIKRSPV